MKALERTTRAGRAGAMARERELMVSQSCGCVVHTLEHPGRYFNEVLKCAAHQAEADATLNAMVLNKVCAKLGKGESE